MALLLLDRATGSGVSARLSLSHLESTPITSLFSPNGFSLNRSGPSLWDGVQTFRNTSNWVPKFSLETPLRSDGFQLRLGIVVIVTSTYRLSESTNES